MRPFLGCVMHWNMVIGFDLSLHIMMLFSCTTHCLDSRHPTDWGGEPRAAEEREREFLAPSIHSLCVRATKGKG